jgi:hypothetical protein
MTIALQDEHYKAGPIDHVQRPVQPHVLSKMQKIGVIIIADMKSKKNMTRK